MTALAMQRNEEFLTRYGGRISSEWYFPKLIQVFEEDRAVYDAMAGFVEAADWIVWYLTGNVRRNSCTAGYKALWAEEGVPSREYFQTVAPGFGDPSAKLGSEFYPLGTKAGCVRPDLAQSLGLPPTVAVAVGNIDAMVAVPALGVDRPGTMVMVMGTSTCHLTVTVEEVRLPGITGVVRDGILPGWYGYEAGQAAVGDVFAWFVRSHLPHGLGNATTDHERAMYAELEARAAKLGPGQSGLVALDWWNGNRSILGDADLSGVMVGLTLTTTLEDQYRALFESTAMGTRRILENFADYGIAITQLIACGGLAQKSPLLMQIYADVTGLPVGVTDSEAIPARGAALFGAAAAGTAQGGFASVAEASQYLGAPIRAQYAPNPHATGIYNELYAIYRRLYDLLGNDSRGILHRLKATRKAQQQDSMVSSSDDPAAVTIRMEGTPAS